jgi:glycosyltransferase involved in cell wall biosynthesis
VRPSPYCLPLVRVHVVDPSAYTPPYDHALCSALAVLDTEVELFTSRFAYGPVARPCGYLRHEFFYRAALGAPAGRVRMASKLAQHVPDMLRYRRAASTANVVHFQWLPVQHLDGHLLPGRRGRHLPLVLTAHDVLPREPRPGQLAAQRRLYARFDAIVVHSEHGRLRLIELGVDGDRVHVIPHGVLTHLAAGGSSAREGAPMVRDAQGRGEGIRSVRDAQGRGEGIRSVRDAQGRGEGIRSVRDAQGRGEGIRSVRDAQGRGEPFAKSTAPRARAHARGAINLESNRPIVLMFGLMRPYKGIDILLDAWRGAQGEAPIEDAELWVVGMPKMDISGLQAGAPSNVRFDPRFVVDDDLPACFERADLVVLPYLQADQSGVLFTALAFGKPLLLSDVGGFPELASTGAARVVPAGDSRALGKALRELLADRATLTEMCVKARAAANGRYSWDQIARQTLTLYRSL